MLTKKSQKTNILFFPINLSSKWHDNFSILYLKIKSDNFWWEFTSLKSNRPFSPSFENTIFLNIHNIGDENSFIVMERVILTWQKRFKLQKGIVQTFCYFWNTCSYEYLPIEHTFMQFYTVNSLSLLDFRWKWSFKKATLFGIF